MKTILQLNRKMLFPAGFLPFITYLLIFVLFSYEVKAIGNTPLKPGHDTSYNCQNAASNVPCSKVDSGCVFPEFLGENTLQSGNNSAEDEYEYLLRYVLDVRKFLTQSVSAFKLEKKISLRDEGVDYAIAGRVDVTRTIPEPSGMLPLYNGIVSGYLRGGDLELEINQEGNISAIYSIFKTVNKGNLYTERKVTLASVKVTANVDGQWSDLTFISNPTPGRGLSFIISGNHTGQLSSQVSYAQTVNSAIQFTGSLTATGNIYSGELILRPELSVQIEPYGKGGPNITVSGAGTFNVATDIFVPDDPMIRFNLPF